jgi:asparagine synthase (glutamine-hydrolysing)
MCGISALFSFDRFDVAPHIRPMSNLIRHRGPDDDGYFLVLHKIEGDRVILGSEDTPHSVYQSSLPYTPKTSINDWSKLPCRLAMGHRRLSIIDLSPAGHQPMITPDERYIIVYNGEVYNYVELRKELVSAGYNFSSNTDTEVILNAYKAWGSDCLHRFNGIFAFVLYDTQEEKVFAARDRFAVKPLYYWFSPKGFLAFASEIKQFSVLPGWRALLNDHRVYEFFSQSWQDHTRETLFADVNQLQGGEFIQCYLSDLHAPLPIKRWYELKPQEVNLDFEKSGDRLKELFYDSIRLQMRADVPIGTGLSGGLDSSSIVCVINELLRNKGTQTLQNTFSSCSYIDAYDERPFIEEVARKTEVKTHYTFPSKEKLFDTFDEILWHQDEPSLDTRIYAEWCVFKMISEASSVKVTLEGHGADELLAGYPIFFKPRLQNLLVNGRWIELAREYFSIRKIHSKNPHLSLANGLRKLITGSGRQTYAFKASWLNISYDEDNISTYIKNDKTVNDMSRVQLLHSSLPAQLHWADRDSMAHSVECRVPFLDHRIVEFVLGCPEDYKIKRGITKRILRNFMSDKLPEKVLQRTDKMGYVTPEEVWVKKDAPDTFMKAIKRALEQSKGKLNNDLILANASKIIYGNVPYDPALWRVISFGSWMEMFSIE